MVIAGAPAFTFKKFLNGVSIGSSAVAEDEERFVKEVEVFFLFFSFFFFFFFFQQKNLFFSTK